MKYELSRYIDAQQQNYDAALSEIKSGRKRSHWMWYVFPQVQGLGTTEISKRYAISSLAEASAYLNHPILGQRLLDISTALLALQSNDAFEIFGAPDDRKLKSSMTLFAMVEHASPVFGQVLEKFYNGEQDQKTIEILEEGS